MARMRWILAGCLIVPCASSLPAATLTVDLQGGADFTAIQAAIDAAADGDTVLVKPGEYVIAEPIDFNRLHDPEDPASPPVKNIVLRSEGGADVTTIRMGEPADRNRGLVVAFEKGEGPGSVLEGFRITGGLGGGIGCKDSSPHIVSCRIVRNWASTGGGICSNGASSPLVEGCAIEGNSASRGGGVSCWHLGSVTLRNCAIEGNGAFEQAGDFSEGGGLFIDARCSVTLDRCTVTGNSAREGGGLLCYPPDGTAILKSCIVWGNSGGSFLSYGSLTISRSCVEGPDVLPGEGNIRDDPLLAGWESAEVWVDPARPGPGDGSAANPYSDPRKATARGFQALAAGSPCIGTGEGGANMGADGGVRQGAPIPLRTVHLAAGTYRAEDLDLFRGASLAGSGEEGTVIEGTLWVLRPGISLSDLAVTGGTPQGILVAPGPGTEIRRCRISRNPGTGISCYGGSPAISGCTIAENGGGLYFVTSSPEVSGCTIKRNASDLAAVVFANSAGSIRDSSIEGNNGASGGGLGCWGASFPTIERCSIIGNYAQAKGTGAALLATWDSVPALRSCTIAGNSGRDTVFSSYGGTPVLTNCTIAGNRCERDVFFSEDAGGRSLRNCIVWGNAPDDDFRCFGCADHSWLGQDPWFVGEGIFDFNRFDTGVVPGSDLPVPNFFVDPPDHHLKPGSPCIDAGTAEGAPTTDIEGRGRPCGNGVDIGAYEFGACPVSATRFVRGNADGEGGIDLSDPILLLTYLFIGGVAPGCLDAADWNDDDHLNISDAVGSLIFQFGGGSPPKSPYPGCGIEDTIEGPGCLSYPGCP
jgi:hypothetical protein